MSDLHAVPDAPRTDLPATFRERAMRALETYQGADLIAYLSMIHEQDMEEVVAQAAAARTSVAEIAQAAGIEQHMLANLMSIVQPVLKLSGENAARAVLHADVLAVVRALLTEAEAQDGAVDAQRLRAALGAQPNVLPWRPLVIGFVPAGHYRLGHFCRVSGEGRRDLPFVGYSMCQEGPDRPMTIHMAFLVEGTVRPQPQLYHQFGLVLEHIE